MVARIAIDDLRNAGTVQEYRELFLRKALIVGLVVYGEAIFGLASIATLLDFHGIGAIHG